MLQTAMASLLHSAVSTAAPYHLLRFAATWTALATTGATTGAAAKRTTAAVSQSLCLNLSLSLSLPLSLCLSRARCLSLSRPLSLSLSLDHRPYTPAPQLSCLTNACSRARDQNAWICQDAFAEYTTPTAQAPPYTRRAACVSAASQDDARCAPIGIEEHPSPAICSASHRCDAAALWKKVPVEP